MTIDRDFRSDTMTTPLPEMVASISTTSWGDAVFDEDEATKKLEQKVADLAGKESGLYCVSGTLSNQLGIRVNLTQPPYSVVCDDRAHVYRHEAGGIATLSQAMVYPVIASNGVHVTLEEIQDRVVLMDDDHLAPTRLICLENTLSGSIMPMKEIERISDWARSHKIHLHLDGARLWNAAAATGTTLEQWCRYFDTVSLCLSKGLCAPVGSVLVGSKEAIKKAKWFRKQQGGGIRQSGWLANSGIIAIDKVWPTMPETHAKAKHLAHELKSRYGVDTTLPVETNMVNLDTSHVDLAKFSAEAEKKNIKVWGARLVLHYWTSDAAISDMIEVVGKSLSKDGSRQVSPSASVYR